MKTQSFTIEKANEIATKINADRSTIDMEQFRMGLEKEMEHGRQYPETNITDDDEVMTGKIALAHLREIPDYYTRLAKMERKATPGSEKLSVNHPWQQTFISNLSAMQQEIKERKEKLETFLKEIPLLQEQLELQRKGEMKKNMLKRIEKCEAFLNEAKDKIRGMTAKAVELEKKMVKETLNGKTVRKRSLSHEIHKLQKRMAAFPSYFENGREQLKKFLHESRVFKAEHATF
ncbi:MAG: hypothetical protein K1X61_04390 [Chitinophagales bacterium]|nr:hypothetical protein [Chitinophagales bacterium]